MPPSGNKPAPIFWGCLILFLWVPMAVSLWVNGWWSFVHQLDNLGFVAFLVAMTALYFIKLRA
jgi:hypothetical protein